MKNSELITALRKPGNVMLPVLVLHDVVYIEGRKADILDYLRRLPSNDDAPWDISEHEGLRYLDTAEVHF